MECDGNTTNDNGERASSQNCHAIEKVPFHHPGEPMGAIGLFRWMVN